MEVKEMKQGKLTGRSYTCKKKELDYHAHLEWILGAAKPELDFSLHTEWILGAVPRRRENLN